MDTNRDALLSFSTTKLFARLAIPGMIGTLVAGLYNLVDAVFVGQYVGKAGIGAISLAYPVVLIVQAVLSLFGVGSASLLSRSIGQQERGAAKRIVGNLCLSVAVVAAALSITTWFCAGFIMEFQGAKNAMRQVGEDYLRVLALGFIPAALGPALNMLIRSEGKVRKAVWIAASGAGLNIVLDPIFISVLGMGVTGAALATVISHTVYLLLCLRHFRTGAAGTKLALGDLKVASELMPRVLSIGVPALSMLLLLSLQQALLYRALARLAGNDHVVLAGVAFRVYLFALIPLLGVGQGLQPAVGMNYGAGNLSRVKDIYVVFTLIATGLAALAWLTLMLFPRGVLSWFITDPKVIDWGYNYFRLMLSTFFLAGLNITTVVLFQALGRSVKAGTIAVMRQIVFFFSLLALLPLFFGTIGVWLTMPVSDVLTVLLSLVLLAYEFRRLRVK